MCPVLGTAGWHQTFPKTWLLVRGGRPSAALFPGRQIWRGWGRTSWFYSFPSPYIHGCEIKFSHSQSGMNGAAESSSVSIVDFPLEETEKFFSAMQACQSEITVHHPLHSRHYEDIHLPGQEHKDLKPTSRITWIKSEKIETVIPGLLDPSIYAQHSCNASGCC